MLISICLSVDFWSIQLVTVLQVDFLPLATPLNLALQPVVSPPPCSFN